MQHSRRDFLATISAGVAGMALGTPRVQAAAETIEPEPFVYKTVGNLELKADVYRPDDDVKRPVLLWIHGGGLIRGYRADVNRQIKSRFIAAGYAIVSIDYRLVPETKLPAIIDDVRDAYTWLHDQGPELFKVDTRHIAVAGDSAGGYLTLMTGVCVQPRPAALVALWGYGDITGDWYTKPSEFYRTSFPLVSKDEAWQGRGGPAVASRPFTDEGSRRFYLYCRQQGLWTRNVTGFDPRTQDELLKPYCPARNVTADYPPTLLVHGTDDTDVPHAQSVQMAAELKRAGVEHELVSVPAAGHDLAGGNPRQVATAYDAAPAFVQRHLPLGLPHN